MKHLKTCIAVSLDGFIARKDNDLDWMLENVKKEISAAYEQPGVFLAGVNTYNMIFKRWGGWSYKSKKTFVVSHYDTNVTKKENVTFLTDMPYGQSMNLNQVRKPTFRLLAAVSL